MPEPRAILPDAQDDQQVILIKATSSLRLTYELRIAAFLAQKSGRALWLCVPRDCLFSARLVGFIAQYGVVVRRD